MTRILAFEPDHLPGVLSLCSSEGWPSFPSDPPRARRALSAPGVTCVVALDETAVVGFAQLLSDGEIQAYLALLVVAPPYRGRGLARALIADALRRGGGQRVDLLTADDASGFYQRLPHHRMPGYRLYPPFGESDLTGQPTPC